MSPRRSFMLVLALIAAAGAMWERPLQLEKHMVNSVGGAMYLDPQNNKTYVLLGIGNLAQADHLEFGLKTISPTREISNFTLFDRRHASFTGNIQGADDGQHLFEAEIGVRVRITIRCTEQLTDGCREIHFRESNNSGLNWTSPQLIHRDNMSDAADRVYPSILYIKETGRLYIFYYHQQNGVGAVGVITRPPGSRVFTKEKLLFTGRPFEPGFSAAYTYTSKHEVLHLTWGETDGFIMYSNSTDAVHWTKPMRLIAGSLAESLFPTDGLVSNTRISNGTLFFGFISTKDRTAYVMESHDEGRTWTRPWQLGPEYASMIRIAYCGAKEAQALFIVYRQQDQVMAVRYNVTSQRLTRLQRPFQELRDPLVPQISCARNPTDGVFSVKVLATVYEPVVAYLTMDTFSPDSEATE